MKKLVPVNQYAIDNLDQKPLYAIEDVRPIADEALELLRPYCVRCEIAGSVRREKELVHDIDIVVIPKPYEIGLLAFDEDFAMVVNRWELVKAELIPNVRRYTRRRLPSGIELDLFIVNEINWGYMLAIKTGSHPFSIQKLAWKWKDKKYKGDDGYLKTLDGKIVPVREEIDLFNRIGIPWVDPRDRNL